jgi:hypothetical protein
MEPVKISSNKLIGADQVAFRITKELNYIPWLDMVFGIVQKGIRPDGSEYPMIWPVTKTSKDSTDIRPDSSINSYAFFELVDSVAANDDLHLGEFNLIVWGNIEKLNDSITDQTMDLALDVIYALKKTSPLLRLDTNSVKLFTRIENVYNYSGLVQRNRQYLTKPYFGFRVNFQVYFKCYGTD